MQPLPIVCSLPGDRKSKVMGLGKWREKQDWPLTWIQCVKEMKVLGFIVCPQFSDTLCSTWGSVFRGFQRTLFAWESRTLCTLQQLVDVAQIFALSKLWYVAQVLPLPSTVLKKIESSLSNFIFQGMHERIKLSELENTIEQGGLGLTCVATKAQCLLLKQSLRVLEKSGRISYFHLGYWLGLSLKEPLPELIEYGKVNQTLLRHYPIHSAILEALEEGFLREDYNPRKLQEATTKSIYKSRIADVILPPKVGLKFPSVDYQNLVYPCLAYKILEPESKDILFCIIHGIVYNKERIYQQGRSQDPYCPLPECHGKVQDLKHIFCSCFLVKEAWTWLLSKLHQNLPATPDVLVTSYTNLEFLKLQFPADTMDQECTWLMGIFCSAVVNTVIGRKRRLKVEELAGRVRGRLQHLGARAVVQPQLFNI